MNVKNAEEGLVKLFKLISVFDLACRKYTEFEIIFLLRFEETFNQQTKNFSVNNKKLNMIQNNINLNKFLVPLCNLERF